MLKKILAFVVMLYAAVAMAAVDVNRATDAELDGVKGIGPVTSKLIMTERKKGEFKNWEDFIARVKGVGENRAAKLSAEGLTVGSASYRPAAAADRKPVTAKVADGAKAGADKTREAGKNAADKTKEVGKDVKDTVTGKKADAGRPAASAVK